MANDFNSTTSGNAKVGRALKRMEFVYKKTSYKFALNPEEYTQSEPNKVTLTQTKGGAWLDAWGAGIIDISIKGTTGVRGNTTDIDTGYNRFKELRNLFKSIYDDAVDGAEITDLLEFYNYTDNEFYYCYPKPDGIELYRSKSRPQIYQYSIGLYALRRIGEPVVQTMTLGNPSKTTSSSSTSSKTTSSSSKKSSGGTSAYRARVTTFSEADYETVTNTRTKANVDIINDAILYTSNLEPIIGGKAGKFSPVTAYQCCSGITMQNSGTVSNVTAFKVADLTESKSVLYRDLEYIPRLSVETYMLYQAVKEYSTDYLSTAYANIIGYTAKERVMKAIGESSTYDSTLFEYASQYRNKAYISKSEFNKLKLVMLETMQVYWDIHKISVMDDYSDPITSDITVSQLESLIQNIQAMILYLKFTSTESNYIYRSDLSCELRKIEKLITQIKTDIVDYL